VDSSVGKLAKAPDGKSVIDNEKSEENDGSAEESK
jgi:hypothetical protein